MRTLDSNYEDWKVGDKVVWEGKVDVCPLFTITEINASARWVFWKQSERSVRRQGSQWENLMRVTERDITNMTDLEKLINELLEVPTTILEGDETAEVHYSVGTVGKSSIVLENWQYCIYLDPGQALALMEWLKEQRGNLEELQDALQAQQIEDASTKEQREAERINALKALHSDAVVAWQEGGCEGPCPTMKDIVLKEQFIRVDLFDESAEAPVFVKQYPMLERLRRQKG